MPARALPGCDGLGSFLFTCRLQILLRTILKCFIVSFPIPTLCISNLGLPGFLVPVHTHPSPGGFPFTRLCKGLPLCLANCLCHHLLPRSSQLSLFQLPDLALAQLSWQFPLSADTQGVAELHLGRPSEPAVITF